MQQAGSLSVLLEPDQFEWKSNFLIIDIREGNINDNSKLLILPINVLLINNLVAPAIFQIKEDKEQYCIGVEICFFAQTSCHEICLAALIVKISTKIWRPIHTSCTQDLEVVFFFDYSSFQLIVGVPYLNVSHGVQKIAIVALKYSTASCGMRGIKTLLR